MNIIGHLKKHEWGKHFQRLDDLMIGSESSLKSCQEKKIHYFCFALFEGGLRC